MATLSNKPRLPMSTIKCTSSINIWKSSSGKCQNPPKVAHSNNERQPQLLTCSHHEKSSSIYTRNETQTVHREPKNKKREKLTPNWWKLFQNDILQASNMPKKDAFPVTSLHTYLSNRMPLLLEVLSLQQDKANRLTPRVSNPLLWVVLNKHL